MSLLIVVVTILAAIGVLVALVHRVCRPLEWVGYPTVLADLALATWFVVFGLVTPWSWVVAGVGAVLAVIDFGRRLVNGRPY